MTKPEAKSRQLHPLPKGLVELYGLLAVLFVLMPEWLAGGALQSFMGSRRGSDLPAASSAWQKLPELRLAFMDVAELRLFAHRLRIPGYASLNREPLTRRLIRRLKRRKTLW